MSSDLCIIILPIAQKWGGGSCAATDGGALAQLSQAPPSRFRRATSPSLYDGKDKWVWAGATLSSPERGGGAKRRRGRVKGWTTL